jgi:hypothetical protein
VCAICSHALHCCWRCCTAAAGVAVLLLLTRFTAAGAAVLLLQVPPEAWGGNVVTLPQATQLANFARDNAGGAQYGEAIFLFQWNAGHCLLVSGLGLN